MFYYAVLNENLFVVDLVASETAITDSTHIAITEAQYTNGNLMWLYYKPESGEFIVCDNWIGSSDWIYYKNTNRPITPKFDEIDNELAGKAAAGHTHELGDITETDSQKIMTAAERTKLAGIAENANNYVHPATHAASMVTGLADVATSGNYNDLLNKPEVPEAYTHPATHPASMITGLSDVATSGDYQDLANKPTIPTIPESLPANGGDADTVDGYHASAFATAQHNHDAAYASASHTHNDLAAVSHTHGQNDITGLASALNGKASASHTHGEATTAAAGFMSAADKTKLNGIAAGANAYTHPASHPASMITGLAGVATSGSYNDLSNKPTIPAAYTHPASHPASMITGLSSVATSGSYNDLTNKPSTFTPAAHTHAQSEISGLASALSGKAAASHNHNSAYISKSLQMTADNGDVSMSWSGKNVVTEFTNLASGMYTVYSPLGNAGNPNSTDSFRFMIHKTGTANYGWMMAYSAKGSVYTGYIDNGNWQGWKCIYDANPQPLWTGGYLMTAGHTVTPSKTLSECAHGWILMWSDYDPGVSVNNTDFCTSVIFKRAYSGQKWAGGEWYCDVPRYSAGTATDSESRIIKVLKIYDNKIVGTENNAAAPRNDVVLRNVFEF